MQAQGREWKSDEHNSHVLQQVIGWMLNAPAGSQKIIKRANAEVTVTFTLDPLKGLLIQGYTGVGKTFIMELIAISAAWFGIKRLKGVSKNICNEAAQCSSENDTKRIMRMKNGNLYLDDIGSEKDMNIYGEKISALDEILNLRKGAFSKRNKLTIGTTNIPYWAYAYGDEKAKDALPMELRDKEKLRQVKFNPLAARERTAWRIIFQPITLLGEAKI